MVEEQEELVRRAREEHWAVWGLENGHLLFINNIIKDNNNEGEIITTDWQRRSCIATCHGEG